MNDAWALDAADAGQATVAMVEQGVDQGAIRIPCCGMHDHAGFFIEHDEVIVFKENLQGNRLGRRDVRHSLRKIYDDEIADFYRIAWFRGLAIAEDVLLADEILDARA